MSGHHTYQSLPPMSRNGVCTVHEEPEPFDQSAEHEAWELRMNEAKNGGPMSVIPSLDASSPRSSHQGASIGREDATPGRNGEKKKVRIRLASPFGNAGKSSLDSRKLTAGSRSILRSRSKREPYVPDRSKPTIPYEGERRFLKKFIAENFQDSELIDYDRAH